MREIGNSPLTDLLIIQLYLIFKAMNITQRVVVSDLNLGEGLGDCLAQNWGFVLKFLAKGLLLQASHFLAHVHAMKKYNRLG